MHSVGWKPQSFQAQSAVERAFLRLASGRAVANESCACMGAPGHTPAVSHPLTRADPAYACRDRNKAQERVVRQRQRRLNAAREDTAQAVV